MRTTNKIILILLFITNYTYGFISKINYQNSNSYIFNIRYSTNLYSNPNCPENYKLWPDNLLRKECCEMAKIVTKLDMWDFFKNESIGLMYMNHEKLNKLKDICWNHGHSAESMAMTLRVIQYIAVNGFEAYNKQIEDYNEKHANLDR